MRMCSWYLRAVASACFAVWGVFASERVTSYRSRLFRHPDHGHEHQKGNHHIHAVHHFLQDLHDGVALHGPHAVQLSDRSRSIAPQFDMSMGNLVSSNLDNHLAFGGNNLVPHSAYRSSVGFRSDELTGIPYDADLGTGMMSLYSIQDDAPPDTGSPFVEGELDSAECPRGSVPIDDVNTCQAAAQYFQKNFDGADSKINRPPGCYIAGDMRGLNLNQDVNGAPDPTARPVCQATLQEASLPGSSDTGPPAPAPEAAPAPPGYPPAPWPAPYPGCPCSGMGGCGCGQSMTTLIPVPLVPVYPGATTTIAINPIAPMTTTMAAIAAPAAPAAQVVPAAAPVAKVVPAAAPAVEVVPARAPAAEVVPAPAPAAEAVSGGNSTEAANPAPAEAQGEAAAAPAPVPAPPAVAESVDAPAPPAVAEPSVVAEPAPAPPAVAEPSVVAEPVPAPAVTESGVGAEPAPAPVVVTEPAPAPAVTESGVVAEPAPAPVVVTEPAPAPAVTEAGVAAEPAPAPAVTEAGVAVEPAPAPAVTEAGVAAEPAPAPVAVAPPAAAPETSPANASFAEQLPS